MEITPEGFSAAFMSMGYGEVRVTGPADGSKPIAGSDQAAVIQKVIVPASMSSQYVDIRIDESLNIVSIHRDFGPVSGAGETMEDRQAELVAAVMADLAADLASE